MGKKSNQLVNVTVPGYDLQKREVNGKTYTVISVPEYPGVTEKGNPDVPRLSANLLIPNGQLPSMTVVSTDYVDIPLEHPLLSSKGHFTRDINQTMCLTHFQTLIRKMNFSQTNYWLRFLPSQCTMFKGLMLISTSFSTTQ